MNILLYIGAAIATVNLLYSSGKVLLKKAPPTRPASWLMWAVLDSLLTWATYAAAPDKLFWLLPFGWTIGAVACMIATAIRGKWDWRWGETLCAICAGVAAYYWLTISDFAGVVAGTIALTIAGIPMAEDMFFAPIRETFPVWMLTVLACAFSVMGSDGTILGVLIPGSSIVFNLVLCAFVVRKK